MAMSWRAGVAAANRPTPHGIRGWVVLSRIVPIALSAAVAVAATPAPKPGGEGPCPEVDVLQKAIVSGIDTDQDKLNNRVVQGGHVVGRKSDYSFKTILANGRHLFTTPFTEADGAGEGRRNANGEGHLGPREEAYNSNLRLILGKLGLPNSDFGKLLDLYEPPFARLDCKGDVRFSILRLNGLDSQSCFECHNSIGSAHLRGEGSASALERKQGTTGGPAGQASNAFINDTFPNPVMKFVRNPPHVFGTGYVQALAQQMTIDLLREKVVAYLTAAAHPGTEVPVSLHSSDTQGRIVVDFGTLKVTYIGGPKPPPDPAKLLDELLSDADVDLTASFREDQTAVHGVSRDLVVRPLQWKGIASNERNFVRSAASFHHGMGARELNPNYLAPNEDHDPDHDGVPDELSEGNVSALAIFTIALRPPQRQVPGGKEKDVERGERLFRGEEVGGRAIGAANSCANCHKTELPLYESRACVRDPRGDVKAGQANDLTAITTLVARQRSSKRLPIYRQLRQRLEHSRHEHPGRMDLKGLDLGGKSPKAAIDAVREAFKLATEPVGCPSAGYEFDLNMTPASEFEALSFCHPRLRPGKDRDGKSVIEVPLFSDLKRHDMGEGLADRFDQPTDVEAINVVRREFLTRPLWGVGDTGPWLHDGRARTLRDAILLHESLGSEANPAIEAFKGLSCDDQAAIVEFLLALRLPLDRRYEPCIDRAVDCHPGPIPPPADSARPEK